MAVDLIHYKHFHRHPTTGITHQIKKGQYSVFPKGVHPPDSHDATSPLLSPSLLLFNGKYCKLKTLVVEF